MKKTGLQILSEIREALDVINGKIAEVELQLAELEGFMDFDDAEEAPVDEPAVAPAAHPVAPQPAPVQVAPEPVQAEPEPPVVEPEPAVAEPESFDITELDTDLSDILPEEPVAPVAEPEAPAVIAQEEPVLEAVEPEPVPVAPVVEAPKPKPAVIDVMADKCAWRTDIPGSPVRNIISGISLNDRILFINSLFKGDAQAFQATITLFNSYETLDQAEAFIRSNYPGWNLDSEIVYRFMMAVRRKLGR